MVKNAVKNGINTGIVFGIITIFLVLIGFHTIVAQLIGSVIPAKEGMNILFLDPAVFDWLVFLGLLGLWAGTSSARKSGAEALNLSLVGSGLSGAIFGLMTCLLAYVIASLSARQVDMSTYLAQLIPDNIKIFLLGKGSGAVLFYFIFILVMNLLGGLLVWIWHKPGVRKPLSASWQRSRTAIRESAPVKGVRENRYGRYAFYGITILIVFLMPLLIGQYWNYTVGTVGIYVVLGLGLNIVVGLAGLLDLGYVAFFAIGAYSMALLTAPAPQHVLWGFWAALPIGIVMAALAGILLGIPVLRMRGDYLAIVTLGFGEIIRILINSDLLSNFSGGPRGVPDVGGPTLFGRPFSNDIDFVYLILLAVLLIIFVTNRLKNSRVGRAWISMREDETVARAMGINTLKYKLMAFSIGAAFAGLGGAIFASRNQFTGPGDHTLMVSINVLCLVIVGGMGSIPGVIAGAFVLKGLPEILRELDNYRVLAFGALLVLMMIVRPEGLIPSSQRRLELSEKQEAAIPQPQEQPEPAEVPELSDTGER